MKFKLVFLAMFTAALSFACAGTSLMARQEPSQMTSQEVMKHRTVIGGSYTPRTLQRTDLVAGGNCEAKLTFDESGGLTKVETDSPSCRVVTEERLLVNGHELLDFSGTVTFSGSCTTCYSTIYGPRCVTRYDRNC